MKKRLLAILLAVVMCLAMAAPAFAADGGFTIENGVLTKYNGSGGSVTISDGVTSIGNDAFRNCTSLTGVTIPSSVTSIGAYAFYNCIRLTTLSTTATGKITFRVDPDVLTTEVDKIRVETPDYLSKYSDGVAGWAQPEVALATRENLVVYRVDGTFRGSGGMTRGDAAIIIYRLFQKIW